MKLDNTIISVPTKEDWRKVVRKLLDEGCYWCPDKKEIYEEYWEKGEAIRVKNDELEHSQFDWYKERGKYKDYKFLTAQEFLREHKFKVGDRVKILSKSNVAECFDEMKTDIPDLIGFITHIEDNGVIYVNQSMVDHQNWTFLKQDLRLLKKQEFKVGDKVKIDWEGSIYNKDKRRDIGEVCEVKEKRIILNKLWENNEDYELDFYPKDLQLLKDLKYEEIIRPLYYTSRGDCIGISGSFLDNLPHEGKFKKMRTFLLRKLSPNQRFLYQHGYKDETLSLTGQGRELLMDVLADKFEKEMIEAARENVKEEEKENKEDE